MIGKLKTSFPRWRIVTDPYLGFEVQIQENRWQAFCGYWRQCAGPGGTIANSFATLQAARAYAYLRPGVPIRRGTVVEYCP